MCLQISTTNDLHIKEKSTPTHTHILLFVSNDICGDSPKFATTPGKFNEISTCTNGNDVNERNTEFNNHYNRINVHART